MQFMIGEKVSAMIYGTPNRFTGTIVDSMVDEGVTRFLVRNDENAMEVWRDENQLEALITVKVPVQISVYA